MLIPGSRLGSYVVTAQIGEGGMGQVYRARDTKLDRDVAIKVLPESFALDADRVARFTREAKTLASLNHANIAAIYGIESDALVMELVEGDDLSAHIARGPVPLADALPIARQIADALEAAHEQGIIHRDLKPANIKVKADGTVKVLDFGLAKAMAPEGAIATPDTANSPTFTVPATEMGMILGTAAYMAPEQAKGKAVDRRADIWAYGVVIYEMLTGRRAFGGDDVSELLVSVLRDTPDLAALPAGTPASIRRLLRRCLEKDPRKRLSSFGDARLELDETDGVPERAVAPGPASRRGLMSGAAASLGLAAFAAAAVWYARPAATLPVRLLDLPSSIAASDNVALSPDGRRVAYVRGGQLYVQALDAVSSQELGPVNTANAANTASYFPGTLFWSPDSKTIGFSAEREIRTVPASGGPVFAVAKIPATGEAIAARWFRDGAIVFAVWRENVYSVPAAGGTPVVALGLDPVTEIDVHAISEAPEGRLIAMIHQRSGDRGVSVLVARGADAKQPRVVLSADPTINQIHYVAPGFLVFDRQKTKTNVGLWVAPFTGGPIDATKATLLQAGAASADIAGDGSLIFALAARSQATPVWVDRAGTVSAIAGAPVPDGGLGFALSPDGRRLALVLGGDEAAALGDDDTSLLVRDLATAADTRLTARAMDGRGSAATSLIQFPSWFPSGDRILLSTGEVEAGDLLVLRSEVATAPRLFARGLILGRITRDGRTLGAVQDDRGKFHLMHAPVSSDGTVGAAQRVFQDADPLVDDFDLSPDGRLVVYAARQPSEQRSIYLSEFPTGRDQWQVAEDAGRPRFSPNGREIFYLSKGTDARGLPTRTLMARTVTVTPRVALGAATALFGGESAALMDRLGYNVAPDGHRFLTLKGIAPAPGEGKRLLWMQNWPAAVKK